MRVAHVLRKYLPTEWGGTETALLQLCTGLRQHNVHSVIYCPQTRNGTRSDPLAESGFRINRFKTCLPIWGISQERKQQQIAVGGNLVSIDLLPALWRERNASVIHTHTLGRLGAMALAAARMRRRPLVVTIHGGFLDLPPSVRQAFHEQAQGGWEWGKLIGFLLQSRRLLELADALLTCNPTEAALLQEKYPRQRVLVHPHGVSTERFRKDHREDAREAFPAIRNRQMLLIVGRIDPPKNQLWVVEQAPEFLRKHPRSLLVLVGACTNETYGDSLKRRVRELGLTQKVILANGIPPSDPRLTGLYQDAASVVLPSTSETFGLVILEAWAAGTPIISSRTSGALSLITPGQDGWLFDLHAPATFHAAVDEALRHPDFAKKLALTGCERVRRDFDVGALAGRMKTLYEELIQTKHALRSAPR